MNLSFFWEPDADGVWFHLLTYGWIAQFNKLLIKWQFREELG